MKFWGCLKVVFSTIAPHCSAKANISFALERHDAKLFSDRRLSWRTRKNVWFEISGTQTSCRVRVNITRGYTSNPTAYSAYLHTFALFQHQPVTHFFQHRSPFFLSRLHPPCPMSHFAAVSRTFLLPPHSFDLSPLLTPRLTLPHLDLWGDASPDKYVFPTHRVHSRAVVFCIFTSFYILSSHYCIVYLTRELTCHVSRRHLPRTAAANELFIYVRWLLLWVEAVPKHSAWHAAENSRREKRRDVVFSSMNTGQDEQGT